MVDTRMEISQAQYDQMAKGFGQTGARYGTKGSWESSYYTNNYKTDGLTLTWKLQNPMDNYKVRFEPQVTRNIVESQTPANPGIREVVVSTHGTVIPVSAGRRVVSGNIVDAEPIAPRLEGASEYTVEERIPRYASGPS